MKTTPWRFEYEEKCTVTFNPDSANAFGGRLQLQHLAGQTSECESEMVERREPVTTTQRSPEQHDRNGQAGRRPGAGSVRDNRECALTIAECDQPAAARRWRRPHPRTATGDHQCVEQFRWNGRTTTGFERELS